MSIVSSNVGCSNLFYNVIWLYQYNILNAPFNPAVHIEDCPKELKALSIRNHQYKKFAAAWPVIAGKWKWPESPSKGIGWTSYRTAMLLSMTQLLKRVRQPSSSEPVMYLSKNKKWQSNVHHENLFLWKQNLQMCQNEWSWTRWRQLWWKISLEKLSTLCTVALAHCLWEAHTCSPPPFFFKRN